MRLCSLWGNNGRARDLLIFSFVVTFSLGVTFTTLGTVHFSDHVVDLAVEFGGGRHTCGVTKVTGHVAAAWASAAAFEILVLLSMWLNIVGQPRRMEDSIFVSANRDGMQYFVIVLFIRLINLGVSTTQDPSSVFLFLTFGWNLGTVCFSRLLIKWSEMESRMRKRSLGDHFVTDTEIYEL